MDSFLFVEARKCYCEKGRQYVSIHLFLYVFSLCTKMKTSNMCGMMRLLTFLEVINTWGKRCHIFIMFSTNSFACAFDGWFFGYIIFLRPFPLQWCNGTQLENWLHNILMHPSSNIYVTVGDGSGHWYKFSFADCRHPCMTSQSHCSEKCPPAKPLPAFWKPLAWHPVIFKESIER